MHDSSDEMAMASVYLEKSRSQIGPKSDRFGTDLGRLFLLPRAPPSVSALHTFEMTHRMHDSSDEMVMTSMYLEKSRRTDLGWIWDVSSPSGAPQRPQSISCSFAASPQRHGFLPLNMAEKDICNSTDMAPLSE
jgi:hypothetical protein